MKMIGKRTCMELTHKYELKYENIKGTKALKTEIKVKIKQPNQ